MARKARKPKPQGLVVTCPTCSIAHNDITENYWQQRKYYCRTCRSGVAKSEYDKHSARIAKNRKKSGIARKAALKYRYGLSISEWERMVQEQNGSCLICSFRPENPSSLHVDHNHITGEVRGLLCNNCNAGLGFFSDSPDRLIKASLYLHGIYN